MDKGSGVCLSYPRMRCSVKLLPGHVLGVLELCLPFFWKLIYRYFLLYHCDPLGRSLKVNNINLFTSIYLLSHTTTPAPQTSNF